MSVDIQTLCFKSIVSFASDLNEAFGAVNNPIGLFFKYLEQITFTQTKKISSTVDIFTQFCSRNSKAILEQDYNALESRVIVHSDKAFIDFEYIFSTASEEQRKYVWAHLLTILAIVDPASRAKHSLQELQTRTPAVNGGEADILNNIISKIEKQVSEAPAESPVELVSKIMQSGTFAEIVADLTSSVERGDIDITKLASSVGLNMPFDRFPGMQR